MQGDSSAPYRLNSPARLLKPGFAQTMAARAPLPPSFLSGVLPDYTNSMRATPPFARSGLDRAKTNKGRFWWELRKRQALSQQAGFIEMQMPRPRPRRATSRPVTSQPPRRAGLNGSIDAPGRPPRAVARPPGGLCGRGMGSGALQAGSFCHRFHSARNHPHPPASSSPSLPDPARLTVALNAGSPITGQGSETCTGLLR